MQSISKINKRFRFLLCVIYIFSKYALVVLLKVKKVATITNPFQNILKSSNKKSNKIWINKCGEFYNDPFKKWLQDNNIATYSTYNEGKSVVAERFIRNLKNEIYKYMTSRLENMHIDKLDNIVNEYNNT